MTLDQFRYFLETARFQHVGRAAKSLHISPSAVSTAISHLEDELGERLFERQGQGIRLTERGQQFRLGLEGIFDELAGYAPASATHRRSRFAEPTDWPPRPFLPRGASRPPGRVFKTDTRN